MPTEIVQYDDPREFDGDTEAVLAYAQDQADKVATLALRMVEDMEWAARNALMTDALELDKLDHLPSYAWGTPSEGGRDPLQYWIESREAGMINRLRGAVGVVVRLLADIREARAVPLAERDPIGKGDPQEIPPLPGN